MRSAKLPFAGMSNGETSGGDWDSDTETNDNKFDDLVHFELAGR